MAQPQLKRSTAPTTPRRGLALYFALPILSWAFYDFANTIFSSNIVTIFFPFYLQEAVGGNEQMNQIASTMITYTNALVSVFLVLLSPLFGVWIDRTGKKKAYLVPFTLISILATALMGVSAMWQTDAELFGLSAPLAGVLVAFMFAKFFFNSSLVFYDPMISDIGTKQELPLISGFGVALGYCGTLIGLVVYPFVEKNHSYQAFLPSAALFLLFCLPMFLLYKDQPAKQVQERKSFFSGYQEIRETFREARAHRGIFLFMIAYFFFNDAIATAISVMAVYAKAVVGFTTGQFVLLYLVSTVSSIIGSFVFGHITKRVGAKKALLYVAAILLVALAMAALAFNQTMLWICGSLYGMAMGATWVTSRTLIVELTPAEKRGQFFGLFAFSGKVSSIVGPALYGTITLLLAEHGNLASRVAIGSLGILVLIGLAVHMRMPYQRTQE
ncbi:MFS transporter [Tumebacillus sp. ITR2]|uniref:MFS transporter n=1 Tax=Tumebacillus amylolyticus TaxID=2801339 RepID=A0ABS1JBT0_9BACL|nr:MFS transporter [Tumebacillus amylolyticus]MBL0387732.1 MFS transporter [Tumebacillus amylolyticus]